MRDRHPHVLIHGYGLLNEHRQLIAGSRMSGLTLYTTLLVEGLAPSYEITFLCGRLLNAAPVDRLLVPGISVVEYDARFPSLLEREGCFIPDLACELYQIKVANLDNPIYSSLASTYRKVISKTQPDLVNAHNLNAICAALHATMNGTQFPPLLATIHDIHPSQLNFISCHQERISGFVAISDAVAEELFAAGIQPHRVRKISNGLDLQPFLEVGNVQWKDVAKTYGLPEDEAFTILVPSRRVPGKGIDKAIYAFDQLMRRRSEPMRLLISGAGLGGSGYETELRRLSNSLRARDQIHFLPKVAYKDTPALFRVADVSLLPSTTPEGFGYANIEAMATKGPIVITTEHGGVLDYMIDGYNGLLLPPGDVMSIVTTLEDLLNESDHYETIRCNARSTSINYSAEAMVKAYDKYIHDILSGNKS